MKVLITNVHSVFNSGDAVLLQVTLQEFAAHFPDAEMVVATNDPDHYVQVQGETSVGSFTSWFKSTTAGASKWRRRSLLAFPWWALQSWLVALTSRFLGRPWPMPANRARRALLSAYCEADLIVSCPGNFFFSSSGLGIPHLLSVYALAYGWLLGKPLYMMPQTIGPLTRRREQWQLGWILKRMRFVALRDDLSLAAVTRLGVPPARCHVFPDSAFLLRGLGDLRPFIDLFAEPLRDIEKAPAAGTAYTQAWPRPYVGVTVIDWAALNRRFTRQAHYEQAVAKALSSFLASQGGAVFIFPHVTGPSRAEDDRIPSARIADLLRRQYTHVVLIDSVWSPDQLKAAYGQMDIFLGTRLHSNIFALTAGTPTVAIAYQYKTHGVLAMLDLDDWVIDIEDVDDALLTARLASLWQMRADVGMALRQRLPALKQKARRAVTWIADDVHQCGMGTPPP